LAKSNFCPIGDFGWDSAVNVVYKLNIPVYFLGVMRIKDLEKTRKLGAQGIAGVSAFLNSGSTYKESCVYIGLGFEGFGEIVGRYAE
jgi:thiamine monophosphate synthase